MTHPLDGCRAKIGRAREHIEELNREARAFAEANPYTVTSEFNSETNAIEMRLWKPPKSPPMRLGLLAGDAIHNLRCSLDQLVYQLAILGSGPGDYTSFPVASSAGKFKSLSKASLDGLLPHHRALIRRAQPYTKTKIGKTLTLLANVDNLDKHRLVPAIIGQAGWNPPTFSEGVTDVEILYRDWVRMDDGAVFLKVHKLSTSARNVQMNIDIRYTTVYGDEHATAVSGTAGSGSDFLIAASVVEEFIESFAAEFQPVAH